MLLEDPKMPAGDGHDHDHAGHDHSHEGHDHAHDAAAHAHDPNYPAHPPEPITITALYYHMTDKGGLLESESQHKFAKKLYYGEVVPPAPIVNNMPYDTLVYFGIAIMLTIVLFRSITSAFRGDQMQAMRNPTRAQAFAEWAVDSLDKFVTGVLGPENGRKYLPYIGTMFIFILVSNLMGLIPLLKPPTGSLVVTLGLALCTFLYVQWTAFTKLGPGAYFHHLAGSPKDGIGYAMMPLFIPLEIIGTLAKPVSLSLRLFGNMLGKDILLGAFITLSIMLTGAILGGVSDYVAIPLTVPFYFLGILFSAIQALVFSILSAIYILMVLPHDHHGHDDHGHGDHAHAH